MSDDSDPMKISRKKWRGLVVWTLRFGLATAASASTGCRSGAAGELQGRWLGQQVEAVPDDQIASATGWARGRSFEVAGSNLTVTIPGQQPQSAPYKVAASNDQDVRLAVARADGKTDFVELTLENEHLMRWHIGSRMSVLLRRED
jgi:hypothetical protein